MKKKLIVAITALFLSLLLLFSIKLIVNNIDVNSSQNSNQNYKDPVNADVKISPTAITDDYSKDGSILILNSINCPTVTGDSEKYSLDKINSDLESFCNDYVKISSSDKIEAEENINADIPYFSQLGKSADYTYFIRGNCLSVLFESSEQRGGANEERRLSSFCFDLVSGNRLTVSDYLNMSYHGAAEYIKDIFSEKIEERPHDYFDNALSVLESEAYDYCFYLSEIGLNLFFNPYVISPGSIGFPIASIPYDKLPS